MNPDNFTHKSNECLVAARDQAESNGHVQVSPVHVTLALLSDLEGVFRHAIAAASGEGSHNVLTSVEKSLHAFLQKIPTQDPAPDNISANATFIKVIKKAQGFQK